MVFSYYQRLPPHLQSVYRASDRVPEVRLSRPEVLRPVMERLQAGLEADDRACVRHACQGLADGMTRDLHVPAVSVRVLAVRPQTPRSELHGLYEPASKGSAFIHLWMRTAARRRVVAFRTFLRTLLHEMCHHLDYHLLKLPDSLHTEGFFKRESSLLDQLAGPADPKRQDTASRSPAPSSG